jgi:adenine deaminase
MTDDTRNVNSTKARIAVALGHDHADMTIVNAHLLNVYTAEMLTDFDIAIKGDRIAYVGPDASHTIGPHTEVIDAQGQPVIPGLIDGHTHMAWMYTAAEFLKHAIPGGTTTIITETLEPYPVAGYAGLIDFLASLQDQPIKIFATVPPMVSTSKTAQGIPLPELEKLLARQDVLGLGETYWQGALQEPDRFLPAFNMVLQHRKNLEGHSAGASEKKLNAYVATGISSCHEPIKADEVLDRLRLGLHVMVREGSIRRDLETIAAIKDYGIDMRRLILSSDGIEPGELLEKGYMEFIVQKAINCGFDPIAAVQMATLNVAEHFGIDHLVGGIAPGKYADLLIIPDMHRIRPVYVISNGTIVAHESRILAPTRTHAFKPASLNTIHLPGDFRPDDFVLSVSTDEPDVTVRVIEMLTDLVTRESQVRLPVVDGEVRIDADQDLVKVAAIDRTHLPGKKCVGLIKNFGVQQGAMACSAAWDTSDILVVGASEADMALAVNRIRALQGGAVVSCQGQVTAELPLPIFGIMSDLPLNELASTMHTVNRAAADLGVAFPDPMLSLIALSGAAIPFCRICEQGLVNLKDGKTYAPLVKP